jgi:high-affinity nickel-transport protein
LFAIGHGAVVTSIAVMISKFSHSWNFSKTVWDLLDWLPGLLLIGVGLMNLRMLTGKKNIYKPKGFKYFFIPKRLKNSSNPMAVVMIGILFAMVFDTNTQAAAWAYTATSRLTSADALLLGLSFSCGMITTDTLDSRIIFTLMLRSLNNNKVLNYRRKLGWIIVYISLIVGGYKILTHLLPEMELKENILTLIGVGFFALMILFYTYTLYKGTTKPSNAINGH